MLMVVNNLYFGIIVINWMQKSSKCVVIRNAVGVRQYAIMEQPNAKTRDYMQDTSFIHDCYLQNCPKSLLFGVFDGHGGSFVSKYLQKNLPTIAKDMYKKNKTSMKSLMESIFVDVNSRIKQSMTKAEQSGSTATLGLIFLEQAKRVLYIGHVGDSLAYVFDDKGGQKITPQHRCDNPEQFSRIEKYGGKILNNRVCGILAVTRAFGDFAFQTSGVTALPQVKRIQLRLSHRYLIVASDGLWDYVQLNKINKIVKQQIQAADICKILVKTAMDNGSSDNVTVIVIRL